ncbi:hypothetical protein [Streptococcus parauberis]|uniref:hypothetical protein n=1 Tax=Streptococcus parauberis TaxID=1348 RepID=UPI00379FD62D
MVTLFIKTNQTVNNVIIEFIKKNISLADILTGVIISLILWLCTFFWIAIINHRKLKAVGISFRKIEKTNDDNIIFISEDEDEYVNGIQNELIIFNPRKTDVFLNVLELTFPQQQEYKFLEEHYQIYLDEEISKLYVLRINNGSQVLSSNELILEFKLYNNNLGEKDSILKYNLSTSTLAKGDIFVIKKINLAEELTHLLKNHNSNQVYVDLSSKDNKLLSSITLYYRSNENLYQNMVQMGGGLNIEFNQLNIPLIELNNDTLPRKIRYTINTTLKPGENILKWVILINSAMNLSYKVELLNLKNKKICKFHVKNSMISFPNYKFNSEFNSEFAGLLKNHNAEGKISFEEVKKINYDEKLYLSINDIEWNKNLLTMDQ